MAIDTASKRRSASGVGHRVGGRGVTPDAAKPVAWRQQAGWGYSGIEAGEAETPAPLCGTAGYAPVLTATAGYAPVLTATAGAEVC